MDLEQIEAEANTTASKHVANMLQRPDQLEKVEQYMRRESRKKTSAEAMLKQAVQTQLDGVKTGLLRLTQTLKELETIKANVKEMEVILSTVPQLSYKLADVKDQSIKHCQYAAAMEHMKHIINVPESVQKTRERIIEGELLLAHQSLYDLENSRDDILFEMHKLPNRSPTEINTLKRYFYDVEKLSEELGKQLWLVLGRTLNSVRKEPQVIVTALRIIEREERLDEIARTKYSGSGYMPISRPKMWKKKAFDVLRSAVLERIEGNQFEDRSENKMWLVRHLEITRILVIEDLKVVKTACVPCFPPGYNIVDEFVRMHHECLAKHLEDIISSGLEDNEYITLLNWIFNYGSVEMLGNPDLNIDVEKFGPLVEKDVVEKLITQYLSNMKLNFRDWMKNSLESDVKDWHRDVEPEQDGNGIFHTSLPVIIFNMLDQNFQVASTVSQDLVNRMIVLSTEQVYAFTSSYDDAILDFKKEYFEDRNSLRFFTYYMIAVCNNCLQFIELTTELSSRYSRGAGLRVEKVFDQTLDAFEKLRVTVLKILKEELFIDLSSHISDLLTRKWLLSDSTIIDTISCTIDDYCQDYKHLRQKNFEMLLNDIQREIAKSYLLALLQRKMTCKAYDERKRMTEKMCDEGKKLQNLFQRLSVFHVKKNSPFEALPCVAEVIKLKDISMLSLEVSGVLRKFPDVSLEQMVSLILLRGDMGKNDAKQLVSDIMAEIGYHAGEKTVFSEIPISL